MKVSDFGLSESRAAGIGIEESRAGHAGSRFLLTRSWLGVPGPILALVVAYVVAHAASLAPSLEDIDSINFALGLRHFDVANHQPHPPGYPVYIALGRISRVMIHAVVPSLPPARLDAIALASWSAIGGGVALLAAWSIFAAL